MRHALLGLPGSDKILVARGLAGGDGQVQASDALLTNDMAIYFINYFSRRSGGSGTE